MHDTRRDEDYFVQLINDLQAAIDETQAALNDGVFTSPSERVDIAQRLFQLAIMRAVAYYSYRASSKSLQPMVLDILQYRQQLSALADKLPTAHQCYRYAFEQLGGQGEACGSANINRYVYTLWWLALLDVCKAPAEHIKAALTIIGEQGKDTLLDKIAIALGDSDRPIANTLYYPDIYQPLSDALTAPEAQQAELLNQFIAHWYDKLTEADWYDNHECDCEFEYTDYYIGYWSFELLLVANILKLPASALTAHPMIPTSLFKHYTS